MKSKKMITITNKILKFEQDINKVQVQLTK